MLLLPGSLVWKTGTEEKVGRVVGGDRWRRRASLEGNPQYMRLEFPLRLEISPNLSHFSLSKAPVPSMIQLPSPLRGEGVG